MGWMGIPRAGCPTGIPPFVKSAGLYVESIYDEGLLCEDFSFDVIDDLCVIDLDAVVNTPTF